MSAAVGLFALRYSHCLDVDAVFGHDDIIVRTPDRREAVVQVHDLVSILKTHMPR